MNGSLVFLVLVLSIQELLDFFNQNVVHGGNLHICFSAAFLLQSKLLASLDS